MSLRHLTFKIYDDESAINWLESGLGVPPKLEELNILYEHDDIFSYDDDHEGLFERQLQRDDTLFGSMYTSGRFPCLKHINIMHATHPQTNLDDSLEVRLRSRLPFIDGTGMLVVKVGTYDDGNHFIEDASMVSCA